MDFKTFPSKEIHGGIGYVAIFPNGYGASIARHSMSYGHTKGLWELAVIHKITGKPFDSDFGFELCYTTPITDDVLGHLTEDEVNDTLLKISELPPKDKLVEDALQMMSEGE